MHTKSLLMLSVCAFALGACGSSGGGGGGGGAGDGGGGGGGEFFTQEWTEDPPNSSLAEFFTQEEAQNISITQHTGNATLSSGSLTLEATAHGEDRNQTTLNLALDTEAVEPPNLTGTVDINSIGQLGAAGVVDGSLGVVFATDGEFNPFDPESPDPSEGDDVAIVVLGDPSELLESETFGVSVNTIEAVGEFDYMSLAAWAAVEVPGEGDTSIDIDFGVGHFGLATPVDEMPTDGTARYMGDFVGIFMNPGTDDDGFVGVAHGNADFTADFSDDSVVGGVYEMYGEGVDLTGEPDGGPLGSIDFHEVEISGNTFSGGVVPGEDGFGGFSEASTGNLDGVFYGPSVGDRGDDGPQEAGVVLTLQDADSDRFVTGAIGGELYD